MTCQRDRPTGRKGSKARKPPEVTGRAVEEYIAVLDDVAFGAATDVVPKFVSPDDPAARWTGAHGGQAFFAYSTNYDVDNGVIVYVEATTAMRQAEVLAAKRLVRGLGEVRTRNVPVQGLRHFDNWPSVAFADHTQSAPPNRHPSTVPTLNSDDAARACIGRAMAIIVCRAGTRGPV